MKTFEIRTENIPIMLGTRKISLIPEVNGATFAAAYDKLRSVQQKVKASGGNKASSTKHAKAEDIDSSVLAELSVAMHEFVTGFVAHESRVDWDSMMIPDRVLVQLMEHCAELYGGGQGNPAADGGTSSD